MARSAPQVSFSVTSVNYGTIDVGGSSPKATTGGYEIFLHGNSVVYTEALNMSISFKDGANSSEARADEWLKVSTPSNPWENIGSVSTGTEAYVGSLVAGSRAPAASGPGISVPVATIMSVPGDATTAGAVTFYLHHRYQYTGDDDDD